MKEIWKDVPGFEGIYQISNRGRLKSFKQFKSGKILSNTNKHGWYFTYVLRHKGKIQTQRIHRLVAGAFIPNPQKKPQINHKDLNKQNNHVDNLEWVTCSENAKHAVKAKPSMIAGMNHYNKYVKTYPIYQFSIEGEFLSEYTSSIDAQGKTGVCYRNILQVANKDEYKPGLTRKQAGGYIWRLKGESA